MWYWYLFFRHFGWQRKNMMIQWYTIKHEGTRVPYFQTNPYGWIWYDLKPPNSICWCSGYCRWFELEGPLEGIQSSKVIYLSHMFSVFFYYVPVFVVAVLLVPSSHMFSQFICVYLSVFLFPFTVERKILQNQFSGPKFHIMYIYNHIYIYYAHF
jgi:hypothetical protein